jgi:hypothetical protein
MAPRKANAAGVAAELERTRLIAWPANSKVYRLRWAESVINEPRGSGRVELGKWQKCDLERTGISSSASGGFRFGVDVLRCYGTAVAYSLVYCAYELLSGNADASLLVSGHTKLRQKYVSGHNK